MKYFVLILLLITGTAYGQTTYYIRADSTRLQKVGGNNELIVENSTKNVLGMLTNYGGGRTRFIRPRMNGDTLFIGMDTLLVGSGGGSTYYNSNVGSGYRLAIPNTNNIKTLGANYGIILDSVTSNQIGIKADTTTLFPAVRATISGGGGIGLSQLNDSLANYLKSSKIKSALKYDNQYLYIRGLVSDEALIRSSILDSINSGTVTAAYSLSRLRSSYTGAAIRVINPMTLVQTDIGFDPDGNFDRHYAKTLYNVGDTLEIIKIYDQSGNGLDLSPISSSHRYKLDLGGDKAAMLTGTASFSGWAYQSSGTTNLSTPKYFFTTEFYNENGQQILFDVGGGNQFEYRMEGGTTGGKRIIATNGSLVTFSNSYLTDSAIASDGIYQTTMLFGTGNDTARVNGTKTYTGVNAGDTPRIGVILSLGDYAGGNSIPWYGKIYEAIIMDGMVDSVDRNKIEQSQIAYYQNGKRIVVFGNSLAYGQLTDDKYVDAYGPRLKSQLSEGWDVINRGSAGDILSNMIQWRYAKEVRPLYRPNAKRNVLILDGGTNDIVGGLSAANVFDSTVVMYNLATADGWDVYIRNLPHQNTWPAYQPTMDAANVLIAAQWPDRFLDARSDPNIGTSGNPSNTAYYYDGVHLTRLGYQTEASYAVPFIDNVISDTTNIGALVITPTANYTDVSSRDNDVFSVQSRNSDAIFSIGTTAPATSAKMEISSTTKGFLPPRMTGAQQAGIVDPVEGLMIYNIDSAAYCFYDGSAWIRLAAASGGTVSPGGSNEDITFNDAGLFGGDNGFKWSKINRKLSVDSIIDISDAAAELHAGGQRFGYRLGSHNWRWTFYNMSWYDPGFDPTWSIYASGGVNGFQMDVIPTSTSIQTLDHNNLGFQAGNATQRVGIGTLAPNASSKLEVSSTTSGFLPPRMTTTQRNAISSPAEGLIVYDLTLHKLYVYDGTTWQAAW